IRACVGVMKKRPEHGGKLLEMLRQRPAPVAAAPTQTPWAPTTQPAASYHQLAERYDRRGDAPMRDRCLTLAAEAASSAGPGEGGERGRKKWGTKTPQQVLASCATFEEAARAGHVQAYLRELRKSHPPDKARELLETPAEPAPTPAPAAPVLDAVAAEPRPL